MTVKARAQDWKPAPGYVDSEAIIAAFEDLRRANAHGFGWLETVEDADGNPAGQHPWLNAPFLDPATGRTLGVGDGILVPVALEHAGATKVLGLDAEGPKRTNAPLATFNALAVALANGTRDLAGAATPALLGKLIPHDLIARFLGGEKGPIDALVALNLAVEVEAKDVRRGDLLQVKWKGGAEHPCLCWDVRRDGAETWIQVLSAQASTHGVGVLLEPEALAVVGKPEPVRRKGLVATQLVHRADPGKPWLGTCAARRFARAHGHWMRVPAKDGDAGLAIESLRVARLHRAFPRLPIALGGSSLVTGTRARAASTELYHRNNEGTPDQPRKGGFFPLGASRTWHGGVHLHPEGKALEVGAFLDGVVVAARLSVESNHSRAGDAGFVLVKSKLTVDGKTIEPFTLVLHLAPFGPDREPDWYSDFAILPPDDDPRWKTDLARDRTWYRVLAPPKESPRGFERGGADAPDGSLRVFDERDRSLEPKKKTLKMGTLVEAVTRLDAHGWAKVRAKDGSVEGWVFGVGRLDRVDLLGLDEKLREKRKKLLAGEAVDLSDLERPIRVRAGETIGWAGKVGGECAVHVEVFSKDLIGMNGKTKPDVDLPDPSLFTDRDAFDDAFFQALDATEEGGKGEDESVRSFMLGRVRDKNDHALPDDVCAFYAESSLRARMRTLVTRHPSEWGTTIDWTKLESSPAFQHVSAAAKKTFRDEVAKLQWWKDGFLASAGLPADQVVHHYHPVTFAAWLDELREKDDSGDLHASLLE